MITLERQTRNNGFADADVVSRGSRLHGPTCDQEICLASLEELATCIRQKRLSPVEVTEAVLRRIDRLQPGFNAFITVMGEQAISAAARATDQIAGGHYRGPLHGVPVALKDVFASRGVRTTAGSKILRDWIPAEDSAVAFRLRQRGAVIVGKLGMHEYALGTTSDNPHFGAVRNPWDSNRVPGGSSGGSAVAVSTGMVFGALGSDTGGSIRIPASECGCVGVKPTYGRVSVRGMVPLAWSLDHAGPLTRTVRDAAIMLQALAGYDPGDPASSSQPVPDWLANIDLGASRLRIGLPQNHFWTQVEGEIADLLTAALDTLSAAGATLVETQFPDAELYSSVVGQIVAVEAAAYHAANYAERKGDYGGIGATLEYGASVPAPEYAKSIRVLHEARSRADMALDGVDVLAVPTMPAPPPTFDEIRSGNYRKRRTVFTSLLDLTGQPVVTVPCGLTSGGLPTGISFVGRWWDEAGVLRAARAYEITRGPFVPPVEGT